MTFDNTNRGALFKNKEKASANHPDYKGKLNVDGEDYWLSSWIKKSKDGKTYMSVSVTKAESRDGGKSAKKADEDPIPF